MLSAVTTSPSTSPPAGLTGRLAGRAPTPAEPGSNPANQSLPDAAAITIGGLRSASPLTNYGLPREVIIARASSAVAQGDYGTGSAQSADRSDDAASPWMLSIASRYVGNYGSQGKAAAAAMNLIA